MTPFIPIASQTDHRRFIKAPIELNVYQTHACNLKCSFCSLTKGETEVALDVTPQILKRAIELYPTIQTACIAGFGEPLVSKYVFDNIQFLNEKGVNVGLITNGILIDKMIADLSHVKLSYVSVSLNAISEEEYQKLVAAKTGDFLKVTNGIALLSQAGLKTYVSFVISKHNYAKIPDFIDFALSCGANFVTLLNILPNITDHYHTQSGFWESVITDEDQEVLESLKKYQTLPQAHRVFVWPKAISKTTCPSTCDSPFVTIGIDGRGMISGCRRVVARSQWNGRLEDGQKTYYWQKEKAMLLGTAPIRDHCKMCFGNW